MRNSTLSKLVRNVKPLWRPIARASFCKLRPSAVRLAGSLAKDGGRPVRDLRLRPWASVNDGNLLRWHFEAVEFFAEFTRPVLKGSHNHRQIGSQNYGHLTAAVDARYRRFDTSFQSHSLPGGVGVMSARRGNRFASFINRPEVKLCQFFAVMQRLRDVPPLSTP